MLFVCARAYTYENACHILRLCHNRSSIFLGHLSMRWNRNRSGTRNSEAYVRLGAGTARMIEKQNRMDTG